IIYGLFNVLFGGQSIDTLFFHHFTRLYDQHPVYFALYITMSIFSITYFYYQNSFKYKKYFFYISLIVLCCGLLLTASKAIIVGFIVLWVYQLNTMIKNKKT